MTTEQPMSNDDRKSAKAFAQEMIAVASRDAPLVEVIGADDPRNGEMFKLHDLSSSTLRKQDCDCEFEADPDGPPDDQADPWHFKRICTHCGCVWLSLHCRHDGHQNPCTACGIRCYVF